MNGYNIFEDELEKTQEVNLDIPDYNLDDDVEILDINENIYNDNLIAKKEGESIYE